MTTKIYSVYPHVTYHNKKKILMAEFHLAAAVSGSWYRATLSLLSGILSRTEPSLMSLLTYVLFLLQSKCQNKTINKRSPVTCKHIQLILQPIFLHYLSLSVGYVRDKSNKYEWIHVGMNWNDSQTPHLTISWTLIGCRIV